MAAHGCHLPIGSLYFLLVIIESFFLAVRDAMITRTVLYKVSIAIASRTFSKKAFSEQRIRVGFDNSAGRIVAFDVTIRISSNLEFFLGPDFNPSIMAGHP